MIDYMDPGFEKFMFPKEFIKINLTDWPSNSKTLIGTILDYTNEIGQNEYNSSLTHHIK